MFSHTLNFLSSRNVNVVADNAGGKEAEGV